MTLVLCKLPYLNTSEEYSLLPSLPSPGPGADQHRRRGWRVLHWSGGSQVVSHLLTSMSPGGWEDTMRWFDKILTWRYSRHSWWAFSRTFSLCNGVSISLSLLNSRHFLDHICHYRKGLSISIALALIQVSTLFIPHICHGRHERRPCKFFLAGVNFYRFNAKNWQFTV